MGFFVGGKKIRWTNKPNSNLAQTCWSSGSTTTTPKVESSNTSESAKQMFHATEGIPPHQQRLVFASGKELEDSSTLANYNVQRESTFILILCLCDGIMQLFVRTRTRGTSTLKAKSLTP